MKRILSLDWDYFIKATALQRGLLFPDGGNENISYALQDFIWDSRYANPELKEIGVLIKEYNTAYNILGKFIEKYICSCGANPHREVLVTISHRWIYDFIMQRTTEDEELEVYNVDFHHDMYNLKTKDQEVNCGNWVNCLFEKRHRMKYFWVAREDSERQVLGGEPVECKTTDFKDLKELDFDYVFICRSDCWSPPHLDTHFETLWSFMRRYMPIEIENRAMTCRKINSLPEMSNLWHEAPEHKR